MAFWGLYCFIINSAYGGNLKAFLTNPGTGQPIDTLSDVLKSGLPWGMVIFFFQIGSEIIPIHIKVNFSNFLQWNMSFICGTEPPTASSNLNHRCKVKDSGMICNRRLEFEPVVGSLNSLNRVSDSENYFFWQNLN